MSKILLAGRMVRFINSMFIASLAATCVFLTSNQTAPQLASAISVLFILVAVLTFAVLTIVRDLISEQHVGIKRLTMVLAAISSVLIPATFWIEVSPTRDEQMVFMGLLVVLSPAVVTALLLYGRRLILWIREGFNVSK